MVNAASAAAPDEAAGSVETVANLVSEALHIQPEWMWITQIFTVIFFTLTASYIANRSLKRLRARFERTHSNWDHTLVEAARKPLRTLIWLLGVSYAVDIIYGETQAEIFSGIDAIRAVGVISVITWWLLRFISAVEANVITRRELKGEEVDPTTVHAISKLLKVSVLITAGLVVLQTLGFSIAGVLAFGGVGGVAMGFAAKDMLANFFGAITIYLDRPFSEGDWIRSPDKQIEGVVEHIGWRQTRIRTFERRPTYVPNALFTTIIVENPSRMSHRRFYETIGLRLEDVGAMQAITDEVRELLRTHPQIDETQLLMVYFTSFGASSADFFIYCFTHTTVWMEFNEVKHELLLKITDIIHKHGAQVAIPASRMHLADSPLMAMQIEPDSEASARSAKPAPAAKPARKTKGKEKPA